MPRLLIAIAVICLLLVSVEISLSFNNGIASYTNLLGRSEVISLSDWRSRSGSRLSMYGTDSLRLRPSQPTSRYYTLSISNLPASQRIYTVAKDGFALNAFAVNRPMVQDVSREQPDENQRAAIMSDDPAILLIAGPGSGKTRVLASRLAYLLVSGRCSPNEVLLLSFTKSAANELLAKANKMLANSVATTNGVICNTFHGFCKSIIHRYSSLTSLSTNKNDFILVDDSDQMRIMQNLLQSAGQSSSPIECTRLLRQIRYWKECGYSHVNLRKKDLKTLAERHAYNIYPAYQEKLKSLSAVDFGDLLLLTLRLLRRNPQIVQKYQHQLKHILVDEFQDISPAQYEILRILCTSNPIDDKDTKDIQPSTPAPAILAHSDTVRNFVSQLLDSRSQPNQSIVNNINVFCAGDDDQSIYSWRGAQVELMKRFRFDFPKSNVIRFDVSYRLSDSLCKVANTIVSPLQGRIVKTLMGNEDTMLRSTVEIKCFADEDQEIGWIAKYIQSLSLTRANSHHSVAILTRSQAQVKVIMDYLLVRKIPFRSRAYGSYMSTSSSRDGSPMNLLRLLANPDDDVAFQAALDNDIITGLLSEQDIQQVIMPVLRTVHDRRVRSSTISFLDATRDCILTGKLEGKYNIALTRFLRKYDAWRNDLQHYFRLGESAQKIVYDILYSAFHSRWNDELMMTVEQLSKSAAGFDSLSEFFSTVRIEGDYIIEPTIGSKGRTVGVITSSSPARDGVTLWIMPMQAAKGLEFDEVILPHWVEGSVPKHANIPEERRLAFVSLTRAREKVLITYAKTRSSVSTSARQPYVNSDHRSGRSVVESLRVSQFVTEILNMQDPATSFNDISAELPPSSSNRFVPAAELSEPTAIHPHLTEYIKKIGTRKSQLENVSPLSQSVPISSKAIVAEIENESIKRPSPPRPQKQSKEVSAIKGRRKAVVEIAIPPAEELTPEIITKLLSSRDVLRKDLEVLFRKRLVDFGIVKGTIPIEPTVGDQSGVRALSKCTADQLGKFLVDLIKAREKQ
jgi:DNA helicase II / ATP-dependent DNA helicase PcrA